MRRLRPILLILLLALVVVSPAAARTRAHYTVILPPAYVGWVQVIFADPAAPPLRRNPYTGGFYITVPESGIVRTSDPHLYDPNTATTLFYWTPSTYPFADLPVPPTQFLPAASLGGFGTADTGDRGGKGYSWFFFIGPESVREATVHADFEHDAAQWHRLHGNYRFAFDGRYPTPGRLSGNAARPTAPSSAALASPGHP